MRESKNLVEDIIEKTLQELIGQGYNKSGFRRYITAYRALAQFSQANHDGVYSQEVGELFLQSKREQKPPLSKSFFRTYVNAIERINNVMEGDLDWRPRVNRTNYAASVFTDVVKKYSDYMSNSGKTVSDTRCRSHIVARFLKYLDDSGLSDIKDMTAKHIYEAFQQATDKEGFHKSVSAFLRYAYRHQLIIEDLSILVPSKSKHTPIPTVYNPDEVEKIISTAKENKRTGKRDYAILLLASRLGLRSCDIVNLKFENINETKQMIEIIQKKTKESLSLPLLPEIKAALDDYVTSERFASDNDFVFLRSCAPSHLAIEPGSVYNIVSRAVKKSGITTKGRKRGPHALRSSLATSLLNEGNSHRLIQKVMGHESPDTLKSYIKTDIENLRSYCLPTPKPSGIFSKMLGVGA